MQYAGIAAFIIVSMCIGVITYCAGYLIASLRARKQIAKISKIALEEIQKNHRAYLEYIINPTHKFTATDPSAQRSKYSGLKIIRSDKDQETPTKQ